MLLGISPLPYRILSQRKTCTFDFEGLPAEVGRDKKFTGRRGQATKGGGFQMMDACCRGAF
jgi:hypothetical protein